MTNALGFDALTGLLHRRIDQLPDQRKPGPNTRYTSKDAALGACGIFYTPSPSFLEYQHPLQQTKGQNNACTLFGVEQIPWNNHVRNVLDPLMPSPLNGVYLDVFEGLEQPGLWRNFRVLAHPLLVALDGTQSHASHAMHCHTCLRRHTSQGRTLYSHRAITPVIVCPGRAEVMAFPPACLMPQDGHEKHDCERVAGKRGIDQYAKQVAPHGVTRLGDDLYSHHPLCPLARQKGCNFLCVCKPDSHATRYERVALWQQTPAIKEVERRCRRGRVIEMMRYRSINDVSLRGGQGALSVNWFAITSVQAKTGAQLYYNSFLTNPHITEDNVAHLAQAGRGRWKIDNDNNHVLKTTGYHLEHTFGPGKQSLAAFLLSLHLLACLFHTVLEGGDDT